MSALHGLSAEAGLQVHWRDAIGEPQVVADATLRAVLAALDLPAASETEIAHSRSTLAAMRRAGAESFHTATLGEAIVLPPTLTGPATLHLENGDRRAVDLAGGRLAPIDEPGYHRLLHAGGGEIVLAIAPPRCFGVRDLAASARPWGVSAQLASLRGSDDTAFGDFATLREAAPALARQGADLLAISPVHALFPADPARFSPYGPSSRTFLNVLYADPRLAGAQARPAGEPDALIDWVHEIPRRLAELRRAFGGLDEAQRRHLARVERVPEAEQRAHAVFDVLDAHFRRQSRYGWRAWPAEFHDPQATAVRAFAAANADEVAFHYWLQGLAERSLAAAQSAARDAGMAGGIVTDLAVGIDPGGSDAWRRPHAYLRGLSVGAPPDLLGPDGQDWGLTTFDPHALPLDHFRAFRDTLAAAMANAGGMRIDHVLGLRRIWVVPHGRPSSEGCYLAFPQADMLRILALESWRHRAIVIGEDLGTIPDGLRDELRAAGLDGMRVLWFERDRAGAFTDPLGWDREAAAMTSTHDVPTLAGWWQGRDMDWAWALGRKSRFASESEEHADRQHERERLWHRLVASGHARGHCPPPYDAWPVVEAACAHIAASACELALIPLEDLFGQLEQPNLPGTIDEHPNWRRRLPESVAALLARPEVTARTKAIAAGRARAIQP